MKTLDRHIIRQFAINYAILFAVLLILVIVIDFIVNIDEFADAVDARMTDWPVVVRFVVVLWDFYWPLSFLIYLFMAPLLTVGAAGFTLGAMIRNRELIALLAGGVSLYRVAVPLLMVSFICSGLLFVNQEWIIPGFKDKLARSHSHLEHGGYRPFRVLFVPDRQRNEAGVLMRNLLLSAGQFDVQAERMTDVMILRRDVAGQATERIVADGAVWDAANRGWRLENGSAQARQQTAVDPAVAEAIGGEGVSMNTITLQPPRPVNFVASDLDPATLVMHRNADVRGLLSRAELRDLMARPTLVDRAELAVMIHGRNALLAVNVLMLVVGLPFFLLRQPANLLRQSVKAAVVVLGAYGGVFVMMRMPVGDLPPMLIAWLPVIALLPLALWQLDRVET